jgi:hypothetical protein
MSVTHLSPAKSSSCRPGPHEARLRRRRLGLSLAATSLFASYAAWQAHQAAIQHHQPGPASLVPVAEPVPVAPRDFTWALPSRIDLPATLKSLEQASRAAGVQLIAIGASEEASSPGRLGHARLTATLQGDYAAVRAVLQGMSEAHNAAVIHKLRISRGDGSSAVQAEVQWWLASQPQR